MIAINKLTKKDITILHDLFYEHRFKVKYRNIYKQIKESVDDLEKFEKLKNNPQDKLI